MASSSRGAFMSADRHYDVIIIGSGAGGGTLAYRLAPSGKKILLLERGDFVPREKQNWDSRAVVVDGRYNNVEPWRDINGKEFVPGAHYFVGGNTKFYGASACAPAQAGFWRSAPPWRYVAGLALEIRRPGALLHRGRVLISGAWHPRRRSDRASRQQTISISARQSRVADP